jgi:succinyl-CoA synthetase beta subunit
MNDAVTEVCFTLLSPKFFTDMNIHEYQGKSILASFGVAVQRGYVAHSPVEALEVAKKLKQETGTGWFVVKAQIRMINVN